jgi:hypothetical protein
MQTSFTILTDEQSIRLVYMDNAVVAMSYNQKKGEMGSISLLFIKERLADSLLEWHWKLECLGRQMNGFVVGVEGLRNKNECNSFQ